MKNNSYILSTLFLLIISCGQNKSNQTILDSDEFNDQLKRINQLTIVVKLPSRIEDAEFELFNVNGFGGSDRTVPGASSWDYKFSVKVKPDSINAWTEGMVLDTIHDYDFTWTSDITKPRSGNWATKSIPEYYVNKDNESTRLIVYRKEGIIFKRILNK